MVELPKSSASKKEQYNVRLSPWTIKLIKAIAWATDEPEGEIARSRLKEALFDQVGGDLQSARDLIAEWESSTQDETKADDDNAK